MDNTKYNAFITDLRKHADILLPGGCNAHCKFCFDSVKKNSELYKTRPTAYIQRIAEILEKIPHDVRKLAITGKEPTASPYFGVLLDLLRQYKQENRFDFMFVNSNGYKLKTFSKQISNSLHAINISRHSADEETNRKLFNSSSVPPKSELLELSNMINMEAGINYNYVLTNPYEINAEKEIDNMVEFCKQTKIPSLTVRFAATEKLQDDLLPDFFCKYKHLQSNETPITRVHLKQQDDVSIVIRQVVQDTTPTLTPDESPAYVIQPNLKVTADWAGIYEREL